jgi:SepF-like predicted cell division protein (DUF552 family)
MTAMGKRKHLHKAPAKEEQYIDLGEMTFEDETLGAHSGHLIKVAEIYRFEDLKTLTKYLYEGHTLLIDYTSISNDDMTLRRVISELNSIAEDTGGDVAGVGKNLLLATSAGIKIDRSKIRGSY